MKEKEQQSEARKVAEEWFSKPMTYKTKELAIDALAEIVGALQVKPRTELEWISVFTVEEQKAIGDLCERQALTAVQLLRCALRDYQMRVLGPVDLGPKSLFSPSAQNDVAQQDLRE